jgi:hypothetical protein
MSKYIDCNKVLAAADLERKVLSLDLKTCPALPQNSFHAADAGGSKSTLFSLRKRHDLQLIVIMLDMKKQSFGRSHYARKFKSNLISAVPQNRRRFFFSSFFLISLRHRPRRSLSNY